MRPNAPSWKSFFWSSPVLVMALAGFAPTHLFTELLWHFFLMGLAILMPWATVTVLAAKRFDQGTQRQGLVTYLAVGTYARLGAVAALIISGQLTFLDQWLPGGGGFSILLMSTGFDLFCAAAIGGLVPPWKRYASSGTGPTEG